MSITTFGVLISSIIEETGIENFKILETISLKMDLFLTGNLFYGAESNGKVEFLCFSNEWVVKACDFLTSLGFENFKEDILYYNNIFIKICSKENLDNILTIQQDIKKNMFLIPGIIKNETSFNELKNFLIKLRSDNDNKNYWW